MKNLHLSQRQLSVVKAMFNEEKGTIIATVDAINPGETELNFKGGIMLTVGSLGLKVGDKIEVTEHGTYTVFLRATPEPVQAAKSGCMPFGEHKSTKR